MIDTAYMEARNMDARTVEPTRPSRQRPPLVDPFQRAITYLRVSVTDRCDFRCVYCMSEHMTFLPKADLLTLEASITSLAKSRVA